MVIKRYHILQFPGLFVFFFHDRNWVWRSEAVPAMLITGDLKEATCVALLIVLCGTAVAYSLGTPNWFVWWLIANPYAL